jgi:hypothetical protein
LAKICEWAGAVDHRYGLIYFTSCCSTPSSDCPFAHDRGNLIKVLGRLAELGPARAAYDAVLETPGLPREIVMLCWKAQILRRTLHDFLSVIDQKKSSATNPYPLKSFGRGVV